MFIRGNVLPLRRILQSILHCGIADATDQSAGRLARINDGALFVLVPGTTARRRLLCGIDSPPPSTASAVAIGTTMPTIDATTVTSRINRAIMLRPPVSNVHRVARITMAIHKGHVHHGSPVSDIPPHTDYRPPSRVTVTSHSQKAHSFAQNMESVRLQMEACRRGHIRRFRPGGRFLRPPTSPRKRHHLGCWRNCSRRKAEICRQKCRCPSSENGG